MKFNIYAIEKDVVKEKIIGIVENVYNMPQALKKAKEQFKNHKIYKEITIKRVKTSLVKKVKYIKEENE